MYLSELHIQNFRQFGDPGIRVEFQPGVSVLAGPNDSGKTAIVDAIRYVLTTKDQEYVRVQPDDYHTNKNGITANEITLTCKFSNLSDDDRATFLEYLSAEPDGRLSLFVQWKASTRSAGTRQWTQTTTSSGSDGTGPVLDSVAKHLLACAYLRPLRDAEREMAPGKNSRLSKVLGNFPGITDGDAFNELTPPEDTQSIESLSLSGLHDYLRYLINKHSGVEVAAQALNRDYLSQISLKRDKLEAEINFVNGVDDVTRLRQILERLELNFLDGPQKPSHGRYGLGSNNLLYMACELLLISKDDEGLPLLLVEEPEAHLHPQSQLQMMQFLENRADKSPELMQVIVSTHSPILASKAKVENIVMVNDGQVFPMSKGKTRLSGSDYGFLDRFLDATKSNLFFANAVLVVEGDAEELLLPLVARLTGHDLTAAGVSIVNVRSTALRRYTKIFQRANGNDDPSESWLNLPVASICDRDIMPDNAPEMLGLLKNDPEQTWNNRKRKWRIENDPLFVLNGNAPKEQQYKEGRENIILKLKADDGQNVQTFPADRWTLEFDLAFFGLAREVYFAALLAKKDEDIRNSTDPEQERCQIKEQARTSFENELEHLSQEDVATSIYKTFHKGTSSKAIAAQYLAEILEEEYEDSPDVLETKLPPYIRNALEVVAPRTQDATH